MRWLAVLGCVALLLCHAHALEKILYLVGGDLDDNNTEIWTSIIHYAGGPSANICVITAASGDPCCGPDSSWPYYLGLFTRYGSQHVLNIPIDPSQKQNAYNQSVVNMLSSCTGWFFSGGDQTRVTDSFFTSGPNRAPTPALQAIRDKFNANGGVVAGSSAGTACQPAGVMITDGWSYYGLRDGTKALPFPNPTENEVTYDPLGGLAFFSFGLLDTHFGERGRQGRFIRLLLDTQAQAPFGRTVGYGMDQNTALVVLLSARTASVVGTGGINIFNISSAKIDKSAPYFTVQNVLYSYATPGDTIDLTTGAVSFAGYKRPLAGREGPLPPFTSTDVFNSPDKPVQSDTKQFIVAAAGLMNSTRSQSSSISWESTPTFGVTMIKDCMTVGYEGVAATGAGAGISFTSFINMRIDIQPTDAQPATPPKGPIITVVVIICVVIAVVYAIYYFHKKQDDEVAARQASEFNHVPLVDDNL